jgi:undecaprenyl-diphosphatase
VWIAIAVVLAILWRWPPIVFWVLAADVLAQVTSLVLRQAIGRDRPAVRFPEPKALVPVPLDGSFPSGHTASSFACALILAWAAPRLAVPLLLLATAVGFSRIYSGVHYPLDVVGGAALGVLVATALRSLAGARPRSGLRPPPG